MVAVFVHQVVGVPLELLSQLLHYFINVLFGKVCRTQSYSLSGEETGLVTWFLRLVCVCLWLCKTHLNLKVSPSSGAFPGLISKMPLKGYGWPPYANSKGNKTYSKVDCEHCFIVTLEGILQELYFKTRSPWTLEGILFKVLNLNYLQMFWF